MKHKFYSQQEKASRFCYFFSYFELFYTIAIFPYKLSCSQRSLATYEGRADIENIASSHAKYC